jgi:hypothetical protein
MMRTAFSAIFLGAVMSAAAAQSAPPPLPKIESTGGVGTVAQSQQAELTADDRGAIARAVRQSGRKVKVPPGVTAAVGSELPPALELYMLPDEALATIPAAKLLKYTIIDDRIVLVDPTTMRVTDILSE